MRLSNYLITFSFIYLLFSCANEQGITGGPKDKTPPKLLSTFPHEDNRTNFKGNKLIFEFDEAIKVQGFSKEVRITPSVEGIENNVQKNRLTINFLEPLEENTTYTINFGSAIRDVTESNASKNLIFAFSTGKEMDSLRLKGTVKNLLNNKKENDVLIALYETKDTLDIKDGNPKYYVFSNNGQFEFNYLKAGQYKLFAVKDKNKNTKYDLNEMVDFSSEIIDLKPENEEINFSLFKESHQENKILSIKQVEDYIQIKVSKSIKKVLSTDNKWIINQKGKLIKTYPIDSKDGKQYNFTFQAIDSLNRQIDTNFVITYKKLPISTNTLFNKINQEDLLYTPNNFQTTLYFNEPIQVNKEEKIELSTGEKSFPLKKDDYLLKNGNSELFIHKKNIDSDTILLIIHKESILSTNNREKAIGKDSILFVKKNLEQYSSLSGKINSNYTHFTIQLIDPNGKIVAEEVNKAIFQFLHVKPNTYSLRILVDENKDGYFEKGSFLDKVQPEKIYFYPEPILLKANWEVNDILLTF